ncbi:bifunctional phosphopantothenoylcysteine decarboxylase/phosphopantothenate--cysteine ligase CoaBC [Dethiobacter alkaliphilus]|uniref:bifunctional phosphopantothenoylcysteine decarboxylase/phosphopantothenate--cysteine ligase CoaBC n=1 Tax=Dethiobacter alkaliphilus TaxID=427926 RepID=UPI002227769A|nr:bifunctional phosphopantothenoylcysteine decarboxylase/phosphopantothenate--cysteine ligase CoaBC [Dethiobacter alkaliphilus]MCW3490904.1 bifunctional phosphopantothenoylcysteine decarboxylase/phosphopantothenate--cysteine ligase CoaBC [Dethiobacter alkaliphilus]
MLSGKTIILGVTGGIAAYKAAELCRLFVKAGANVRVVMTDSAKQFVTPLTFQTVSGNRVYDDLFTASQLYSVEHVGLAQNADLFVIAPATANCIGKAAAGIADDLLTTTVLAATCPVIFAPAMNTQMYENTITQQNIAKLIEAGYHFAEPEAGELACGDSGRGRMASPAAIFNQACALLAPKNQYQGLHMVVTAGPTQEPLDPVRYFTNHSSGKMGFAIARAAAEQGADVTLVSGPVDLTSPPGVELIRVTTAEEMYRAVMDAYPKADLVIKAAAVADYRPATVHGQKMKKGGEMAIPLVRNPDILAELGKKKENQILVGFAAETENLQENATGKLARKNLDMIVANDLTMAGAGFKADTNIVRLYFRDGTEKELPLMTKDEVARQILHEATQLLTKQ